MQMFGLVNVRRIGKGAGVGHSDGSHSKRACRHFGSSKEVRKWSYLAFFAKKDTHLFSWVEWIVKDLLPFSFCKKPTTWKFSLLDAILVEI
jgi:hypothetical protein